MTDVAVEGTRRTHAAVVATAAVTLGVLAFAADSVTGIVGQVLIALTSSGFAWGLAAVLAGRSAATARRAVGGATALLVLATLLYYLLVLLVSRRWSGGNLRVGKARTSALAAGAICGLLCGEGWRAVILAPPWQLLTVSDPY